MKTPLLYPPVPFYFAGRNPLGPLISTTEICGGEVRSLSLLRKEVGAHVRAMGDTAPGRITADEKGV